MINIANNLNVTHNLQSISSKPSEEGLENAINKLCQTIKLPHSSIHCISTFILPLYMLNVIKDIH